MQWGDAVNDNVRHLRLADTTDARIERCLRGLTECKGDTGIPDDVRHKLDAAHAALHACRSPATVAQMERDMGIGPEAA